MTINSTSQPAKIARAGRGIAAARSARIGGTVDSGVFVPRKRARMKQRLQFDRSNIGAGFGIGARTR